MISAEVIDLLVQRHESIAVAESITGGLIAASLTETPGASRVFLGGCVTYATESKLALLGLDKSLIELHGVISRDVAEAMALSVREKFSSTWGVATTGVAGPGPHDGRAAGEVWIAVSGPLNATEHLALGDIGRAKVRSGAVTSALTLLSRILRAG